MKTQEELELLFRAFEGVRKSGLSKGNYLTCIGGLGALSWALELPEAADAGRSFDEMVAEQRALEGRGLAE